MNVNVNEKEGLLLLNNWFFSGLKKSDLIKPIHLVDYLGEQILVTRECEAFLNSCPHRGTQLLQADSDKSKIVCPYHRWTFDLHGDCIGSPFCDKEESNVRLRPVNLDVWHDLIFLSFGNPIRLSERFAPMEPYISDCPIETFTQKHHITRELQTHWKLAHQNFSENYHSIFWHPELEERSTKQFSFCPDDLRSLLAVHGDHFDIGTIAGDSLTMSQKAYSGNKKIVYFSIYPNLLPSLTGDYLFIQRIMPLSNLTTQIDCYFYAAPNVDMADVVDFWMMVFEQDRMICEAAQKGNSSRFFPGNHYTHHDYEVKIFTEKLEGDLAKVVV